MRRHRIGHPARQRSDRLRGTGAGFTLIELLMVITIIALLMSILLPVLGLAHERTVRSVCQSQVHQLDVLLGMYVQENGRPPLVSRMPSVSPAPVAGDQPVFIADVLAPLAGGQRRVFHCPKDQPGWSEREPPNTGKSYFESEHSSYFLDLSLGSLLQGYERFHFGKECRDPNPVVW
jgi:prepilin-type N-terminal cleavage/methylation domain-containing protein